MKNLLILLVFAAVVAAGCIGQQASADVNQTDGTTEVRMTIVHTSYGLSKITANEGDTVRILATSAAGQSSHNHGITIDEFGVNEAVITEDTNNPKIIQFTADKKGTFLIYCKTCWDGPYGRNHPNITAVLEVV